MKVVWSLFDLKWFLKPIEHFQGNVTVSLWQSLCLYLPFSAVNDLLCEVFFNKESLFLRGLWCYKLQVDMAEQPAMPAKNQRVLLLQYGIDLSLLSVSQID